MGKVITPKYRVEYRTNHLAMGITAADMVTRDGRRVNTMIWSGRVSAERLKTWRDDYNRSFENGGANFHVSQGRGGILRIHWARIVEQRTGRVVAEYTAPAFEAA
jgi:hypothetical protein